MVPTPKPTIVLTNKLHFEPCAPIDRASFLAKYTGGKRIKYAVGYDAMQTGVYKTNTVCFVKMARFAPNEKHDPSPRVVSFRNPQFCAQLGCYIRGIEHQLFGMEPQWVFKYPDFIAKSHNLAKRATIIFDKFKRFPYCYSIDCSRFEAHINAMLIDLEHSVYLKCYNNDKLLRALLKVQKVNKFNSRFGVSGTFPCRRLSGDMNTACGNVIIMLNVLGSYFEQYPQPFDVYDDGDDCLLFVHTLAESQFVDWFRSAGLVIRIEHKAQSPEEVVFCQHHPVYDDENGHGIMVPDINKHLASAYTGFHFHGLKRTKAQCATMARCWSAMYADVPMLGAFHRTVAKLFKSDRVVYDNKEQEFYATNIATVIQLRSGPKLRNSFYRAFGFTPFEQTRFEYLIEFGNGVAPIRDAISFDHITLTSVAQHIGPF